MDLGMVQTTDIRRRSDRLCNGDASPITISCVNDSDASSVRRSQPLPQTLLRQWLAGSDFESFRMSEDPTISRAKRPFLRPWVDRPTLTYR
jgi:hypothetical protein